MRCKCRCIEINIYIYMYIVIIFHCKWHSSQVSLQVTFSDIHCNFIALIASDIHCKWHSSHHWCDCHTCHGGTCHTCVCRYKSTCEYRYQCMYKWPAYFQFPQPLIYPSPKTKPYTVDINSFLYRWDSEVNLFEKTPFQTFQTSANTDLAFFRLASWYASHACWFL